MKRSRVGIAEVADWHNLSRAFRLAARGKRGLPEVEAFGRDLERELSRLRDDLTSGRVAVGRTRRFLIRDPKPRIIHAPCFRERVLHHALMAQVGPVLDRALVADTYACREGKGALAVVRRAHEHLRRHPWLAQIDIRRYFASIDHWILLELLARRLKDRGVLALIARIVAAHQDAPRKGLPIGALTSQHFANFYLASADRLLLEGCRVDGYVRYMDDLVWWGRDRATVRAALAAAREHLADKLSLEIKAPVIVGQSRHGFGFCGYRITPDRLLLSRRRKRRYAARRRAWEDAFVAGRIDARTLQAGYSSALAITLHADAAAWRREQLRRHVLEPALEAL
jgi:hypothetical protein